MTTEGGGWTAVSDLYPSTCEYPIAPELNGLPFSDFLAVYGTEYIFSTTGTAETYGSLAALSGYGPQCSGVVCTGARWSSFSRSDGGTASHTIEFFDNGHDELHNFGGHYSHCSGPFGPGYGSSQGTHCVLSSDLFWNGVAIAGPIELYLR